MKKTSKTTFLYALLLVGFVQSLNGQTWELKKDKGGIKVYVRDQANTDIKELKFTTQVEAPLSTIAAVLTDVEGFDDWVYASVLSRTIKKVSDGEVIYYTEVDFPWPFDNRDLVLHTKFWQDKKTLTIHSTTKTAHWMESEKDGLVRIKKIEIKWAFIPIGNGKVNVEYYLNSDPGGSIPAWMVNLAADQGPLQTMVKFKEMLKKPKYHNTKLAFVQDK